MSWHCLPELAVGFLAGNCSDGARYVQSKWSHTLETCCLPASATESLICSLFGTTCEPSTDGSGAATLMSSAVDSRVKTFPLQEAAPDSTENDPDSGVKWRGLFARFDPSTHSLRTAQLSLIEDSNGCYPTLPRSGLMLRGECFLLQTLAPRICESESGSSGETWATPKASDGEKGGPNQRHGTGSMTLPAQVSRWPTPVTNGMNGGSNSRNSAKKRGMFPTATATASKGWSKNHNRAMTDDRLDYTIEREANESGNHGRLNPDFVSWLMGWPRGWEAVEHEDVCELRKTNGAQEIQQRHAGRQRPIFAPQILRQDMHGRSYEEGKPNTWGHIKEARFSKEGLLRTLRDIGATWNPSQRQELAQQLDIEFDDALQFVSYLFASQSGRHYSDERESALFNLREAVISAWAVLHPSDTIEEIWRSMPSKTKDWCVLAACAGPWVMEWPNVSRTTTRAIHRIHRIRALGNGQVARVAAEAFSRLSRVLTWRADTA